jgi:hypothetical protein
MKNFPYITPYVNDVLNREQRRLDYVLLRPLLLAVYYFARLTLFPFKFLFHRNAWGFEGRCIDSVLCFGLKYLAAHDAVELIVRHVQIEPLLYRFLLQNGNPEEFKQNIAGELKGIDGDFSVNTARDVVQHNLTLCHDDLAYEVWERFDKETFLENLNQLRNSLPEDHEQFGKEMLAVNRKHSLQLLGCTNVVILIVFTITIFGDLKSVVRALNSFESDSLLHWCLQHIYRNDLPSLIDLSYHLPSESNRSQYRTGPFLSDPSMYLYNHIAFDEYAYELLRTRPADFSNLNTEEKRNDTVLHH